MEGAAASTLATFLTDVGTVITSGVEWLGTFVGVIVSTPVLLVPCALGIAGTCIGLYHSLK